MKFAIIGGGFTGLSAGIELVDNGHEVTIFESGDKLGGLASGFKPKDWKWPLEIFYHHIFTNDKDIIGVAKKVGCPPVILSPITTSFIDGKEIQLDSPISVLKFKKLSFFNRIWMGAGLAFLKVVPSGLFLEKYRVVDLLPKLIGNQGYEVIWEKLLKAKFGKFTDRVNMAWFWTRVAKRTQKLGYFNGGFQSLINKMGDYLSKNGATIKLNTQIKEIKRTESGKLLVDGKKYDKVLVTVPAPMVDKIIGKGEINWPKIDYLWGQTMVLELNRKMINGYWMNILENNWPFLVAVEHTNMIKKSNYGNKILLYLGNYLEEGDKRLEMSNEELLKMYIPYLKKINKNFKKQWITGVFRFKQPYSQPVFPTNYSSMVPGFEAKSKNIFVANMSMVYPFDRGTNYAVRMGIEVARLMLSEL